MARKRSRISAFLVALCAALPVVAQAPAQAAALPLFGSCQGIRRLIPFAHDGNYLLVNNGRIFTVYCHNMSTAPSEYITLARTGADANFSQYTAGDASPGTNVRTSFRRVRVNPATLAVDIGDLTFASSTGDLLHAGAIDVTSMPYGVAMGCDGTANGLGNIDLRGTPFSVNDTFELGGFIASGSANVSSNDQVVGLRGGGFCGWITSSPTIFDPFNPSPGMYQLDLTCARNVVITGGGICIQAGQADRLSTQVVDQRGERHLVLRYGGSPIAVLSMDGRVLSQA